MNETMAGLIITCFSVLLVYLLWRVWRLAGDMLRSEAREKRRIEADETQTHRDCIHDLYERDRKRALDTASLARALGYEWKRTDAKEGWEKKPDGFWIGGPAGDPVDRRGTRPDRRKEAKKPRRAH